MRVRQALVGVMIGGIVLTAAALGGLGLQQTLDRVEEEAEARVGSSLRAVRRQFDAALHGLERDVGAIAGRLAARGQDRMDFAFAMRGRRIAVLNAYGTDGRHFGGSAPAPPIDPFADPLLAAARSGEAASGVVLLTSDELAARAGEDLLRTLAIPTTESGADDDAQLAPFMFLWAAAPVQDDAGRVTAVVSGGRPLNRDFELVDELQGLVFSAEEYAGKPLGTVTIFARDVRIATNVRDPQGRRAIGTRVSEPVRQRVLRDGVRWLGEAAVVDADYLSAYEPLRDPAGDIIGMLYVGLLQAPYDDLRTAAATRMIIVMLLSVLLLGGVGTWIVRRLTEPLARLAQASRRIGDGDWDAPVPHERTYLEVRELVHAFDEMRQAIVRRDQALRRNNAELEEANRELDRVNRNYMKTLGFVTHELKSPLGAMQMMIDTIVKGYVGEVSDRARDFLLRISRNAEELQDMVKNYLDLSRLERGELTASKREIDLFDDVIRPCVEHSRPLFDDRSMTLDEPEPTPLPMIADPELLRIGVFNYLSNAAKYGREGGRAELTVKTTDDGAVVLRVWNEGPGFTAEERDALFQQFSRLQNAATRGRKGSGVGLFLTLHIAQLHGGEVEAESEPGEWAAFSLKIPRGAAAPAPSGSADDV